MKLTESCQKLQYQQYENLGYTITNVFTVGNLVSVCVLTPARGFLHICENLKNLMPTYRQKMFCTALRLIDFSAD
jgi:hypothetical protein